MMSRIYFISTLCMGLIAEKAWSQSDFFDVSQLQEATVLQTCRSDLLEIDENGDMQLDRDEYAGFLQLQTGNQMSGYFQFLPFRMESVYFAAACMCNVVAPPDNKCCLNGNDHVPLDTSQSPVIDAYLDFFCYNVQTGLLAEGFTINNPPESTLISYPTDSPSAIPSDSPSDAPSLVASDFPTLWPSDFPSDVPSDLPSHVPSDFPSDVPSDIPSDFPSQIPTRLPSRAPTGPPITISPSKIPTTILTETPSDFPSDTPTPMLSAAPSVGPSRHPSEWDSSSPTNASSKSASVRPTSISSETPSKSPPTPSPIASATKPPTNTPSARPIETSPLINPEDTLCVDFQYVVRNQVGLTAEAIFSEDNNNVLKGLQGASETITIEILNGTYPGRRILADETPVIIQELGQPGSKFSKKNDVYLRRSRPEKELKFTDVTPKELSKDELKSAGQQNGSAHDDQLRSHWRKLAYYTKILPVAINSVRDNPLCAGSAQNPQIVCAIVSSTVCVVLEEGDNPAEVRNLMVAGLRQAVDSGDFLRRIPPADLTMTR